MSNESFSDLGLSESTLISLEKKGFERPTEIQSKLILEFFKHNADIIAQAQTGTGKTAAYGLPLIEAISPKAKEVQALILTPTRELTMQVSEELHSFKGDNSLRVISIYGGASIEKQMQQLRKGAQIVVGSPGRIIDHIKRRTLSIDVLKYLVLDEADEMLNQGFIEDIDFLNKHAPEDKRTLLISATFSETLKNLAQSMMIDPVLIETQAAKKLDNKTEQLFYEVNERDKLNALCRLIDVTPNLYTIVFCKTKRDVDIYAQDLINKGYPAEAIHGDLSQAQRNRVLSLFKQKKYTILVATDVAARGIDINNLTHVFNLSIPQDAESYVHRIGRTGRAGKEGIAITILSPQEFSRFQRYQKMLKTSITKSKLPSTKNVLDVKKEQFISRVKSIDYSENKEHIQQLINDLSETLSQEEILYKCMDSMIQRDFDESLIPDIDCLFDQKNRPIKQGQRRSLSSRNHRQDRNNRSSSWRDKKPRRPQKRSY